MAVWHLKTSSFATALLLVSTLNISFSVHANEKLPCSIKTLTTIGTFLKEQDLSQSKQLIDHTCKVWPKHPQLTLATLALEKSEQDPYGEAKYLWIVAVINTTNYHAIQAIYTEQLSSDAAFSIGADSLSIDTATYNLDAKLPTFGVRIDSNYLVRASHDGGINNYLNLFTLHDNRLKPVLKNFITHQWRYTTANPSTNNAPKKYSVETATTYLYPAATATNRMADLNISVVTKLENFDAEDADHVGAIKTQKPYRQFKYRLKFDKSKDNGRYDSSAFEESFFKWWSNPLTAN